MKIKLLKKPEKGIFAVWSVMISPINGLQFQFWDNNPLMDCPIYENSEDVEIVDHSVSKYWEFHIIESVHGDIYHFLSPAEFVETDFWGKYFDDDDQNTIDIVLDYKQKI